MIFIEQERQRLLKKCNDALEENIKDANDAIAELECIDKIYEGTTLRPDNIEFVYSVAQDAIDSAKSIIADNEKLQEAKFKLLAKKQMPPYASGEAG